MSVNKTNYHVSSDGVVRTCSTTPEKCPVKGLDGEKAQHFSSTDEATEYIEGYMHGKYGNKPMRKITEKTKMLAELDQTLLLANTEFEKGNFRPHPNVEMTNRQKKLIRLLESGMWSEASDHLKFATLNALSETHYHIGASSHRRDNLKLSNRDEGTLTVSVNTNEQAEKRRPIIQKLHRRISGSQNTLNIQKAMFEQQKKEEARREAIEKKAESKTSTTNEDYFVSFMEKDDTDYNEKINNLFKASHRGQSFSSTGAEITSGWNKVHLDSGDVIKVQYKDDNAKEAVIELNGVNFKVEEDGKDNWSYPRRVNYRP